MKRRMPLLSAILHFVSALVWSLVVASGIVLIFVLIALAQRAFGYECQHEFVGGVEVLTTGSAGFVYKVRGTELELYSMRVESTFQRKGIGSRLFGEMLSRAPRVSRISAMMMFDNLSVWMQTRGTCEERFRATPLGKMTSRAGFTYVAECEPMPSGIWITVERTQ